MITGGTLYNDTDPYCVQWLRNLIAAGCIAGGDVNDRDIRDLNADDLEGYRRCHFFAGIAGWDHALNLARWPATRPVWTGSCPCQPFSNAGRQGGGADERHLWPQWLRLIRQCRPDVIFGEQVAGAVGFGWIDRVFADLEAEGYACGAAVLGAHSVGAPHIRQRLFWVADADNQSAEHQLRVTGDTHKAERDLSRRHRDAGLGLGDTERPRLEGQPRLPGDDGAQHPAAQRAGETVPAPWDDLAWIVCRDRKKRPTQPGIHPLAARLPGDVGRLRAYGNAIVPQAAAQFIASFMQTQQEAAP